MRRPAPCTFGLAPVSCAAMSVSRRRQRHVVWFGLLALLGNLLVAPFAHAAMLRADAAPWARDICTTVKSADAANPAGKADRSSTGAHLGHGHCGFCGNTAPVLPPVSTEANVAPHAEPPVAYFGYPWIAPATLRYVGAARPQAPPVAL